MKWDIKIQKKYADQFGFWWEKKEDKEIEISIYLYEYKYSSEIFWHYG